MYTIKLRGNPTAANPHGKVLGTRGPYSTLAEAKRDAQKVADEHDKAVSIEPAARPKAQGSQRKANSSAYGLAVEAVVKAEEKKTQAAIREAEKHIARLGGSKASRLYTRLDRIAKKNGAKAKKNPKSRRRTFFDAGSKAVAKRLSAYAMSLGFPLVWRAEGGAGHRYIGAWHGKADVVSAMSEKAGKTETKRLAKLHGVGGLHPWRTPNGIKAKGKATGGKKRKNPKGWTAAQHGDTVQYTRKVPGGGEIIVTEPYRSWPMWQVNIRNLGGYTGAHYSNADTYEDAFKKAREAEARYAKKANPKRAKGPGEPAGYVDTMFYDPAHGRAASVRGKTGSFHVIFGRKERGEFIVAHGKPSKTYKTARGAHNAASKWVGQGPKRNPPKRRTNRAGLTWTQGAGGWQHTAGPYTVTKMKSGKYALYKSGKKQSEHALLRDAKGAAGERRTISGRSAGPGLVNPAKKRRKNAAPESVLGPGAASKSANVASFLAALEAIYRQHFPTGYYVARAERKFGHNSIYVATATLPKGAQSGGIIQNDPSYNTFWMHDSYTDAGMNPRIKVEMSQGGRVYGPNMRDAKKVGWRNGTASPASILKKFDKYFAKLATMVAARKTNPKTRNPVKGGTIEVRIRKVKGRNKAAYRGVSYADANWHHMTVADAKRALRDGQIDIGGYGGVVHVVKAGTKRNPVGIKVKGSGHMKPNPLTLTAKDRRVIDSFLDGKANKTGKNLWTDGKQLDGLWMGGKGIAKWVGGTYWDGGKLVLPQAASKSVETNWFKGLPKKNPSKSTRTTGPYTVEVIDFLNDKYVQQLRGGSTRKEADKVFAKMKKRYTGRLDQYIIQIVGERLGRASIVKAIGGPMSKKNGGRKRATGPFAKGAPRRNPTREFALLP